MISTTNLAPRPRPVMQTGTIAAIIAFACTAIYSGMKVVMARRGELGLPGFPAKASSYAGRDTISQDEWMLAALGLAAAGVALATLLPWTARVPRWIVVAAVWVAGISQAAGAAGFTLRALRILPDLGPGPQGWETWVVLLILDAGAVAWLVLAWHVTRHGQPAASGQTA